MSNLNSIQDFQDYQSLLKMIEVTEQSLQSLKQSLAQLQEFAPDNEKCSTLKDWIEQEKKDLEFLQRMKRIQDKLIKQA